MKTKPGLRQILFLTAMVLIVGCYRNDIRTVVYSVPDMKNRACIDVIQNALGAVDGIRSADPDAAARTVAVTYDSRLLAIKNIEYVITGAGFDCNDSKAKPEAKEALPPECR